LFRDVASGNYLIFLRYNFIKDMLRRAAPPCPVIRLAAAREVRRVSSTTNGSLL